jgi:hypothetical protein
MKSAIYRNYKIYKLIGEPDGISEKLDLFINKHLTDLKIFTDNDCPGWLFYGKNQKNIIINYYLPFKRIYYSNEVIYKPFDVIFNFDTTTEVDDFFECYFMSKLNIEISEIKTSIFKNAI